MHVVRVGGLEAAASYTYGVRVAGAIVGRGRFTTPPAPDSSAPLTFLVYGDDRSDQTTHAAVVRSLALTPSDVLINTGDVVADGGNAGDWQSFFEVEAPLLRERPLLLAIGNHELYDDSAGANFARYFGFDDASGTLQPYGTVRLGNVRFFFLNGMHDWDSGPERSWLTAELTHADTEPGLVWRVAVVHHGPWSSGPHGANAKLVDAHVPELLVAHKVDLLLSGHDHIYERGDGGPLKYIISGGGGAPLYRISPPMLATRKAESTYHFVEVTTGPAGIKTVAHRLDGTILERCGFAKGTAWDCDALPGTSPPAAGAPSSTAPSDGPPSAPRCGCEVPGARAASALVPVALLALGALAALALARRRSRRG
jgi:hypothetical protein